MFYVYCLDDHGVEVLATSRGFALEADAVAYAATVSPSRNPVVREWQ